MAAWEVQLTIPSSTVGSNLTDFPLSIDLSQMTASFWANVTSNGGDIRAYDSSLNELPVDVIDIDTGAETGFIFVKVPLILAASDTVIYLSGDGTSSAYAPDATYGSEAVWTDFEVVYMLAGDLTDRTANSHDLTAAVGSPASSYVPFALGAGGGLDVTTDLRLQIENALAGGTVFTVGASGSFSTFAGSNFYAFFNIGQSVGSNTHRLALGLRDSTNTPSTWDFSNGFLDAPAVSIDEIIRLHGVWNGSTEKLNYVNGNLEATDSGISAIGGSNDTIMLCDNGFGTGHHRGKLGFVYVRYEVLSADWLAAEYLMLNDPATMYSAGAVLPAITNITPSEGSTSGGTAVTITGIGFTGATGVLFGANAGTSVVVVDDNTITCVSPAGTAGLVDVTVQHGDGNAVETDGFEYVAILAPVITDIDPDNGTTNGGTSVTITGTDLTDTSSVTFDGVSATSVVVVNDTTVTCDTPAHAAGLVDVALTTPGGTDTVVDGYLYKPPARITQVPILIVQKPVQPVRVTQIPILVSNLPLQGSRVTQVSILPVWTPTPIPLPLPVVPDVPVVEVWQYKTVVNIAEKGREQRSQLRGEPRFNMDFSATILNDEERRDVYQMLFKYINRVFNYPMFVYSTKLTASSSSSTSKLYFNPAYTDMRAGEGIALFDPQLEETTVLTISTVDADGATLTEPLTVDVPAYFYVAPAPQFRTQPVVGLQMDAIGGSIDLRLEGAQSRDMLRPNQSGGLLTLIDGMLLLDKRPLADDDVEENFDQNVTWLDNEIAPPEPRTNWFTPFIDGERQFLIHRPVDLDYWRAVADNLKGQQNPFLLPTFRDDLPLASQPALDATSIESTNIQFFDFWRSTAWRYIRIQSDAGVIYRRINEVLANYDADGNPISVTIKLASSIGSAAGSNQNMVVSYVNTCRLNNDNIVLRHGDVNSTLTLSIRLIEQ